MNLYFFIIANVYEIIIKKYKYFNNRLLTRLMVPHRMLSELIVQGC